jgi:amino acid transporter
LSSEATRSTSQSNPTELHRALGLPIAIAVVVGNVIGSGIFLKPGNIAGEGGRFDLIIAVWAFGGLLCLLGGLCFAELATMLPRAGGLYVYLSEAYGKGVGFLFGWTEVIFGKPASIGALAVAFVGSFSLALGWLPSTMVAVALSAALIIALAGINIAGVLWGGRMQLVVTIIKAGFLAVVAVLPFALTPFISDGVDFSNYATTVTPRQLSLAGQVGTVLLAVMWAYNGWHGITPLAEEVRNPQRNIPLALFIGIGILIALYLSANVAYHGVLSMEEMQAAGDHAAEKMLSMLLGRAGLSAMSAVIMCSTFGAINSNLLQAPRISFAMGRDGVFFRSLGQVHATCRTPAAAIVVMAVMSILLVVAVAVAKELVVSVDPAGFDAGLVRRIIESLKDDSTFSLLTNFVIFSASIFYVLGVLAVIVLRVRRPDLHRPYRTWGYPLTPIAFLLVYVWFLGQIYVDKPLESRVGLILIAIGVPVFFAYRAKKKWEGGKV